MKRRWYSDASDAGVASGPPNGFWRSMNENVLWSTARTATMKISTGTTATGWVPPGGSENTATATMPNGASAKTSAP